MVMFSDSAGGLSYESWVVKTIPQFMIHLFGPQRDQTCAINEWPSSELGALGRRPIWSIYDPYMIHMWSICDPYIYNIININYCVYIYIIWIIFRGAMVKLDVVRLIQRTHPFTWLYQSLWTCKAGPLGSLPHRTIPAARWYRPVQPVASMNHKII